MSTTTTGRMTMADARDLATQLVGSYGVDLEQAVRTATGWDSLARDGFQRQFFLGNGGCWTIGFNAADTLRGRTLASEVPRAWHPHDVAGALTTNGFRASFAQLLLDDALGDGDLIHVISGSGRSANLLAAVDVARRRQVSVVAHCGHDGGPLRAIVAEGAHVSSFDQQMVEDALTLRLWPAHAEDDVLVGSAVEALVDVLAAGVQRLARTATAVVDAIGQGEPIGVVAFDTAVVSASAEHVAHNLCWDMCWDLPPSLQPQVHFALSNGLLTAVANDSGVDTEPFHHLMRPVGISGLTLNLGRNRATGIPRDDRSEFGIPLETFELLQAHAARMGLDRRDHEYLRGAYVQLWGHLVMRLGRALARERLSPTGALDRLCSARRPVAPRMQRDG
jgi:hypothetical protein